MRQLIRRTWHFVGRRRFERDLAEEMEFHRQMAQEELGSSRGVGNITLARDQARDVWTWPWLQDISQDVRFAARLLVKDRRFTAAALIALALGIGVNTAAFTFLNAVLQDPPYEKASQLVIIEVVDTRTRSSEAPQNVPPLGVSYPDFVDWQRSSRALSGLVISSQQPMNVSDEGLAAERFMGAYVSANVFRVLGTAPVLGRAFTADDEPTGALPVVMIAHTVWNTRYGGDPKVIGRVIRVNDVQSTVVGVMPEQFHFPFGNEIWQPIGVNTNTMAARREVRTPITMAFGRLADSVTIDQAQTELDGISRRLAEMYPATNGTIGIRLIPLQEIFTGGLRRLSMMLMGAGIFVLLIACVNVGNLLLSRVTGRAREIAIRSSLGATRRRIVRQLMIESLVLAVLAGAFGILVGELGVRLFVASFTPILYGAPPPYWLDMEVDAQAYAFLAAVCLGTSIIFGLAPALHVSRTSVNESLKEGGRGSVSGGRGARRWTGALVVAQLALTLVLLAGAGMIGRGFLELYRAGQIIDTSDIVTMRLALAVQKYRTPEQRKLFFRELDERLAANRSLSLATVASDVPFMTLTGSRRALTIEGDETPSGQPPPSVSYIYVGPRYFETLRVKLTRGRPFVEQDGRAGHEGAIVNERFVSLFLADTNPIGRRIRLVNAGAPNATAPWFTIVGVVPTIPQIVIMEEHDPIVYVTVEGEPAPHRFASIIVRSNAATAAAVAELREEVRKVDSDLPGYYIQTMDELLASSRFSHRLYGAIFLLLAAIALILATVGLFALTAHGVAERTREIGVRMALGAESRTVVWLFVRRAIVLLVIGLALGVAGSLAAGRYFGTFLPRTDARDPLTLAAVSTVLIAVGLAAAVFPARRAARVDPLVALRYD